MSRAAPPRPPLQLIFDHPNHHASAAQYAERLLLTKPKLSQKASKIANELVHEYKDHGFVIDLAEAQQHLGEDWVKSGTAKIAVAEAVYSHFDWVNLLLGLYHSKRLLVTGRLDSNGILILKNQRE